MRGKTTLYLKDECIKREDAIDAVLFALVGTCYQSRAIRAIRDCTTADVVPRSEVDWHREAELNAQRIMELEVELEAMRGAANSYKMHYENLAREIFEEIENLSVNTVDDWGNSVQIIGEIDYAELKKKYTDETIT